MVYKIILKKCQYEKNHWSFKTEKILMVKKKRKKDIYWIITKNPITKP